MSRCVEPTVIASSALPGSLIVESHAGGHRAAERRLREAVAGVAGGDDHHHAAPHEPIDLDAQRALAAGEPLRLEVVADAHVDAVNLQPASVAVDLLNRRDGGDQVARRALSVARRAPSG